MKLESRKVYLRPYEIEFAPVYYQWFYSGKYEDYFRHCAESYRLADFQRWVDDRSVKVFNIFDKETNLIVGTCGIYDLNITNRRCKLAIMIDEEYQGKLYMQDALIILGKLAVVDCQIHKIQVEVMESNQRLMKHIENAGFKKEYVEIDKYLGEGKFVNEALFLLLGDDFKGRYYGV